MSHGAVSRRRVPMTLADVYDKSDLFAIGRMMYECLVPDAPFPTSSTTRPQCSDDEVTCL